MRLLHIFLLGVAIWLLPHHAFAPIFGTFPGLDRLIQRSDVIVVAELSKEDLRVVPALGGPLLYGNINLLHTIKGKIEKKPAVLLSILPLQLPASASTTGFDPLEEWALDLRKDPPPVKVVLFLEPRGKDKEGFRVMNDKGEEITYGATPPRFSNLNCEGSIIELETAIDLKPISKLPAREAVLNLVQQSADATKDPKVKERWQQLLQELRSEGK